MKNYFPTQAQPLASKKSIAYAASSVDELIQNGMRKMAFVMSENLIVKHSVNNFKSASSSADIQYFENMDKASKWLDSE